MGKQISYCPLCGAEFEETTGMSDSRSAPGLKCEDCNETLKLRVNRFPLAQ